MTYRERIGVDPGPIGPVAEGRSASPRCVPQSAQSALLAYLRARLQPPWCLDIVRIRYSQVEARAYCLWTICCRCARPYPGAVGQSVHCCGELHPAAFEALICRLDLADPGVIERAKRWTDGVNAHQPWEVRGYL